MIIIGLVLGGIIAGQDIVMNAKLRNITSDIEQYKATIQTFKSRYGYLPGDMPNASDVWPDCMDDPLDCGGDNDGVISSNGGGFDEGLLAWRHLYLAGLLLVPYSGERESNRIVVGTNVPKMNIRGAGLRIGYQDPVSWYGYNGHTFQLGASSGLQMGGYVLTPKEAYTIDLKIDDGISRSGKVEHRGGGGLPCVIANGQLGSGWNYDVTNDDVACTLTFFW